MYEPVSVRVSRSNSAAIADPTWRVIGYTKPNRCLNNLALPYMDKYENEHSKPSDFGLGLLCKMNAKGACREKTSPTANCQWNQLLLCTYCATQSCTEATTPFCTPEQATSILLSGSHSRLGANSPLRLFNGANGEIQLIPEIVRYLFDSASPSTKI
jgi:hypothetical protein